MIIDKSIKHSGVILTDVEWSFSWYATDFKRNYLFSIDKQTCIAFIYSDVENRMNAILNRKYNRSLGLT